MSESMADRMKAIQAEWEREERADGGFIEPDEPIRKRLDRLDVLLAEVLPTLTLEALSPEARAIYGDLLSENEVRRERARRRLRLRTLPAKSIPEHDAATTDGER